jgi:hypothetical protein
MWRFVATSVLGAFAAVAGACEPTGYRPRLAFRTASTRTATASVEVAFVPSAECGELATSGLDSAMRGRAVAFALDATAEPLGEISPGVIGLYARARDAQCRVVAAGCAAYAVVAGGAGDLDVALDPVARGCVCAGCNAGRCPLEPARDAHAPGIALYENGIAPMFQNETYNAGAGSDRWGIACDPSRFVSPPCSYGVSPHDYGAVRIVMRDRGSIPADSVDVLEFAIHTDGHPLSGFHAVLIGENNTYLTAQAITLTPSYVMATRADGWAHVVIETAELNPTRGPIAGAEVQSGTAATQTAHVDDVRLGSRPCHPPW